MSDRLSPRALTRRELLASALILPIAGAWPQRRSDELPTLPDIWQAPWRVVGGPGADTLIVTRQRVSGQNFAASRVSNPTDRPVSVKEVVLCEVSLRLIPPDTLVYGEGFQMLTQTAGSVGNPVDAGSYTDAKHYRLPTATNTDGARTFYGMMKIGSVLRIAMRRSTPCRSGCWRSPRAAVSAGSSAFTARHRSKWSSTRKA